MKKADIIARIAFWCFLLLAAAGILLWGGDGCRAEEKQVVIGNKNFTEQYIIGQMMKQLLEEEGFAVVLRPDLTSMALRAGMQSGEVDLSAEYTGTAWMIHLKQKYSPGTGNNALYEKVKNTEKENGFIWLAPIWNNNTYGLASWPDFVSEHGLKTLSDLAELYRSRDGEIQTFINFEFSARPDGLHALEDIYDFEIARSHLKTVTPGVSVLGLEQHEATVAMVFGTDPTIPQHDWHLYPDDKSAFPPYDLTPYIRQKVLDEHPKIQDILSRLTATFPGGGKPATSKIVADCREVWQKLNARVDVERKDPQEVARDYLLEHGLLKK